jgi:hypothetical protein
MPAKTSPPGHTSAPPANSSQQHPTNAAPARKADEKKKK